MVEFICPNISFFRTILARHSIPHKVIFLISQLTHLGQSRHQCPRYPAAFCPPLSFPLLPYLPNSGHGGMINQLLTFGNYVFSSSYDRTARCWELDTGDYLREFKGHAHAVIPMLFIEKKTDPPPKEKSPTPPPGEICVLCNLLTL